MMFALMIAAILAALGVGAGEVADRTFARWKADASRSRMASPEKVRLRI
jgi:hypothetical protein